MSDFRVSLPSRSMDVLRLYVQHMRRLGWRWLALFVFVALGVGMQFFIPWAIKLFVDALTLSTAQGVKESPAIMMAIVWYAVIKTTQQTGWRLAGLIGPATILTTEKNVMQSAFEQVFKQSYAFFTDEFSGSLTRRVQRLADSFSRLVDLVLWQLFPALVSTVAMLVVMLVSFPQMGLVFVVWLLAYLLIVAAFIKWKLPADYERAEKEARQTAMIADSITNGLNVLLFNGKPIEQRRFEETQEAWYKVAHRSWKLGEISYLVQAVAVVVLEFGLMIMSWRGWQRGQMTVGDVVWVLGMVSMLNGQLWGIGRSLRSVFEAIGTARESINTLFKTPTVLDAARAKALKVSKGRIEFEAVRFNYANGNLVVPKFEVKIHPREKVALVGPSGAGKSTILKLLLRAYDPTSGAITIDGQNLAKVAQESLHEAMAFVPQEPMLFHRSLMDNIRYGRMEATDEEVMEAAKKAYCHDFITKLPQGYETHVGERGVKLSGGERQRVAIARAILREAPILILDEATSSLDSESEALIQKALHELMQKKTVIVIAHRLSTVMEMDRLLVIEGGQLVDEGTHAELLKRDGLYRNLWNIQAGGFGKKG